MLGALKRYLVSQFGDPRGLVGMLTGRIMATRQSNRERNLWTIERLDLQPHHRVFEIGFGPGFALGEVCRKLTTGIAIGLDRSATMARMAAGHNRRWIETGRLQLHVGSVEDRALDTIPALAGPFDRIFAVNVILFWRDPVAVLHALAGRLSPDGRLLITLQPKSGDRSQAGVMAKAGQIVDQFAQAGLTDIRVDRLETVAPWAFCVCGTRPAA